MADVKLTDLAPNFYSVPRNGDIVRKDMGITFNCPCGCNEFVSLPFSNPIDGGDAISKLTWERTGDTLETLTLRPSIQRLGKCKWHGFLTDGVFKEC